MNFSNFVPASTKEWILYGIILLSLVWVVIQNKALLKCKEIQADYVEELRVLKLEHEKGKQGIVDELFSKED